jgi:hypothetical protein
VVVVSVVDHVLSLRDNERKRTVCNAVVVAGVSSLIETVDLLGA